jgi:hypothetical protein
MRSSAEISHEVGHCLVGLLMGGELLNASADHESREGNTRFSFPPAVKSAGDLHRLAFADALYSVSGMGAEWAFSRESIDPRRSAYDLDLFRKTFEAHRHTDAFRWAKSYEFAETVLVAVAEQVCLDHEESCRFLADALKSRNAIIHRDVAAWGKWPHDLGPGMDWVSWFSETMTRASARLAAEEAMHVQRELFNARQRALMEQIRLTQGV